MKDWIVSMNVLLLCMERVMWNRRLESKMKECLRKCMCMLKVVMCAYLIYVAYMTWQTEVSAAVRFEPHGDKSARHLTARVDIIRPEKEKPGV